MGIIKQRRQRRLRKEAAIAARTREVRLWKARGLTRAEVADALDCPESSINKMYKDA